MSGGHVTGRVLASRRDSRLSLVDDPTPSVSLALGDGSCRLHLEQADSAQANNVRDDESKDGNPAAREM